MEDITIKLEPVDQVPTSEDERVALKEGLVTPTGIPTDSLTLRYVTTEEEPMVGPESVDQQQHQIVRSETLKQEKPDNSNNCPHTEQSRLNNAHTSTRKPFPVALYQNDASCISNTGSNIDYFDPNNPSIKYDRRMKNAKQTEDKPYKCSFCRYSCAQKGNLIRHEKTHTGEKSYICTMCPYSCAMKASLKIHERTHTGEKPYKCPICSYSCSQQGNLTAHERTHTGEKPFRCSLCSYNCAVKGHLKIHERSHTGEKPFKCPLCPFRCSQKTYLKTHGRTHTVENPYKCSLCSYSCATKGHLKRHGKTHTG